MSAYAIGVTGSRPMALRHTDRRVLTERIGFVRTADARPPRWRGQPSSAELDGKGITLGARRNMRRRKDYRTKSSRGAGEIAVRLSHKRNERHRLPQKHDSLRAFGASSRQGVNKTSTTIDPKISVLREILISTIPHSWSRVFSNGTASDSYSVAIGSCRSGFGHNDFHLGRTWPSDERRLQQWRRHHLERRRQSHTNHAGAQRCVRSRRPVR